MGLGYKFSVANQAPIRFDSCLTGRRCSRLDLVVRFERNWHLTLMDAVQDAIEFRAKRSARPLYPLRDGREKTKAFPVGRGQPCTDRYKRSVARGEASGALIRKALEFFGRVSWQAIGWRETSAASA
jgi:hypothetical protein